jgi:hypothetical protein
MVNKVKRTVTDSSWDSAVEDVRYYSTRVKEKKGNKRNPN